MYDYYYNRDYEPQFLGLPSFISHGINEIKDYRGEKR